MKTLITYILATIALYATFFVFFELPVVWYKYPTMWVTSSSFIYYMVLSVRHYLGGQK